MYLEDVSNLDKNTLISSELIEEIFSIDSEIERQISISRCRDQAKMRGCLRDFDGIISSAKKELKRLKKASVIEEHFSSQMSFCIEGEDIFFNCGAWQFDEYGIFTVVNMVKAYACPHAIFPKRILVNAEDSTCKVEICFQVRNGAWRTISVPRSLVASSNKIISLADYGVQVTSENAKLLVKYLSDIESLNSDLIYEQTSTSRLGWVNGVFVPYCNDSIVFDNEQSMKSLFSSVHSEGSYDKWLDCVKTVRKEQKLPVLIYMAASLASALVEPCGTLPFIVSIWGATGLGKTVALNLAASIWADPGEGRYMADAKATTTAMEIKLDCLNSLPMCLDDMAQVQSKFDGDFSQLIYYWCQGKGRERSNQQLGLNKPTRWANCTLTNGERSMITESTQGGAVNRVIDVEIGDAPLFENGNHIIKVLRKNYGFAGKIFVQTIQSYGFDCVYQMFEKYHKTLRELSDQRGQSKEDKQLTPMALILTADELAEKHIYEDGIRLDINDCIELLKDKESTSEYKRAYEYIEDFIAMNVSRFSDNFDNPLEIWGHQYEGTTDKFAFIKSKFDEMLDSAGYSSKSFVPWAARKGIIETISEKGRNGKPRYSQKVTISSGQRPRCYVINLNVDLDNQSDEFVDLDPTDEPPFDNLK